MVPAYSKFAAALTALTLTFALSGCGDDDDENASDGGTESTSPSGPSEVTSSSPAVSSSPATPTSSPKGTTIEVTFDGDNVTPNGDRVEVERGHDVTLVVAADKPGGGSQFRDRWPGACFAVG